MFQSKSLLNKRQQGVSKVSQSNEPIFDYLLKVKHTSVSHFQKHPIKHNGEYNGGFGSAEL